jgi:hypothetical protein
MEEKKVNFKLWFNYFLVFWAGITIANLIYYLRFSNEVLRRELIYFMEKGNGYFLTWFYLILLRF